MVKALDSIAATICQTCSPTARVGAQLYALSEQLTGREWAERPPGSVWSCLGSGSPTLAGSPKECSSPQVWAWVQIPLLTDLFFFFFGILILPFYIVYSKFIPYFVKFSSSFFSSTLSWQLLSTEVASRWM